MSRIEEADKQRRAIESGAPPDRISKDFIILQQQAEIYALKKQPCKWTQDEFFEVDGGFYNTSCGNEFSLTDGTPEENNMKYCPFCGGLIKHKGE